MTAFTFTTANSDDLHWPARIDRLDSLEEHIRLATRLSRALWSAVDALDCSTDSRDKWALYELAGEVADHASAAYFVLCRDEDRAEAEKKAAAAPAPMPAPAVGPIGDAPSPLDTAYELALNQKNRSAGLATLLDAAFDARGRFDKDEAEGIATLARDIAKTSAEVFEAVRLASLSRGAK